MQKKTRNMLLSLILMFVTCCAILGVFELVFRHRYGHYFYTINDQVKTIQSYLVLHPKLGFTWKKNIEPKGIILKNEDTELDPLSSDKNGFLNHPDAIKANRNADIIGLGDSFIEHANHTFYEQFKEQGITYYSMAIHRQSPPQYNIILEDYALQRKPKWVIYGLYENDFKELEDYEDWLRSGINWFTFHSGTWCGRPLSISPRERFLNKHFRGFFALEKVLNEKFEYRTEATEKFSPDKVANHIMTAQKLAEENGIRLLLVLIPSKETSTTAPTAESGLYDEVLKKVGEKVPDILDLRPHFTKEENPASLYYKIDGHWNRKGMKKTGELILDYIREIPPT